MTNAISKVILTNLAHNEKNPSSVPENVEISRYLDDRYLVSIKIGDWETKISKEDLRRIL